MGDTRGQARIIVFNPNDVNVEVNYQFLNRTQTSNQKLVVGSGKAAMLPYYIPRDSGARVWTDGLPIFAVGNTDTVSWRTGGQIFDWGFPLIPADQLSTQVLIGWGYGCARNRCQGLHFDSRSVVFISPTEDAVLHVDFDNDGVVDRNITAKKLSSIRLADSDDDMTGALIYATNSANELVTVSAAWGQFAELSYSSDQYGQDLGTVVVPFHSVKVSSSVSIVNNHEKCETGRVLEWIVRLVNVGPTDVAPGEVDISQDLPDHLRYVPGSTKYRFETANGGSSTVAIQDTATGFPLSPLAKNKRMIAKRGGTAEISFQTTFTGVDTVTILNKGSVKHNNVIPLGYESSIECHEMVVQGFSASIPSLPSSNLRGDCGSRTA